jgi:two-component system nitrogen regulation sensor histidine kinase NtrY
MSAASPRKIETIRLLTKKRVAITGLLIVWLILTVAQWRMFRGGIGGSPAETTIAFGLINLNIIVILLLLFLSLRNVAKLIVERKRGAMGSHLKTKLVLAFLATTVIPTTLLFLASASFLSLSVDRWFSQRVDQALKNAIDVARTYYGSEERQVAWAGRALADRLESETPANPGAKEVTGLLKPELASLEIHHVHLLQKGAENIAVNADKAPAPASVDAESAEIRSAFAQGKANSLIVQAPEGSYLRSITPVMREGKVSAVLLVDRYMPVWTLRRLEEIRNGFEEYKQTELLKKPIKGSYILPLLFVSILITFAAIWFGFYLARTITEPIGALADATHRIAVGDLDFELQVSTGDEMGKLVQAFNLMTKDLRESRAHVDAAQETLKGTNAELNARRIYMETVLERITAGVVGTDPSGVITTINHSAIKLLGITGEAEGLSYRKVLSEEVRKTVEDVFAEKRKEKSDVVQKQVVLPGEVSGRTVMAHLTTLRGEGGAILGHVLVLNDLTDLVKAQKAQAWREVARRVAHEIKNPLTPIQLSAQRLRRRYGELLETPDGEVLDESTRTIITQVDGLKYMVNEFSRFAKLPESKPVPASFNPVVEEVVTLYRTPHPDIEFDVKLAEDLPTVEIDVEQVKRALVNLMDNAVSALEEVDKPRIEVTTGHDPEREVIRLTVADNGHGLTSSAREKLFEPYFSTKKSGTGLGLAIVKTIMEDHRGYVRAVDNPPRGTRFVLEFPLPGAEA